MEVRWVCKRGINRFLSRLMDDSSAELSGVGAETFGLRGILNAFHQSDIVVWTVPGVYYFANPNYWIARELGLIEPREKSHVYLYRKTMCLISG